MFDYIGIPAVTSTASLTAREQYAFVCQLGSGIAAPSSEETRLSQLETRRQNWDGYGTAAPTDRSLASARAWLDELKSVTEYCGRPWTRPLIGSSAEGEVTFEWWSGNRKLMLYFTDQRVEYIRGWGTNIEDHMESGELITSDEFRDLWNWLRR